MYIPFTREKLTMLGLLITFLIVNAKGHGWAQNGQKETISKDRYTLELHLYKSEDVRDDICGSEVPCGSYEKEVEAEISDGFAMTISEETLEELLKAFGAELGIGTAEARVKAKIELRNRLLRKTEYFRERKILIKTTETLPIKELPCYNQSAFIEYRRERYNVKMKKERWMRSDKESEFDWEENTKFLVKVQIKHDENCGSPCQIQNKRDPVRGKDGQQLWAHIPYKKKAIYIVPLWWGKDGKLIDPIGLLPKEIQEEITEEVR